MAKATNKPSRVGKSDTAEQPVKTEIELSNEKSKAQIYQENKADIDTALRRCCAHLKKMEPSVARETISRLKDYYIRHGIKTPRLKFPFG